MRHSRLREVNGESIISNYISEKLYSIFSHAKYNFFYIFTCEVITTFSNKHYIQSVFSFILYLAVKSMHIKNK